MTQKVGLIIIQRRANLVFVLEYKTDVEANVYI